VSPGAPGLRPQVANAGPGVAQQAKDGKTKPDRFARGLDRPSAYGRQTSWSVEPTGEISPHGRGLAAARPARQRSRVRTTNPIERFMGELEKAADHVPIWENPHTWERHVWILWKRLKHRSYRPTRPRPEFTRTS